MFIFSPETFLKGISQKVSINCHPLVMYFCLTSKNKPINKLGQAFGAMGGLFGIPASQVEMLGFGSNSYTTIRFPANHTL